MVFTECFPPSFEYIPLSFLNMLIQALTVLFIQELLQTSRTFPLLKYHPSDRYEFLRGAIKLDGNVALNSDWVEEQIVLPSGESIKYLLSWADWAYTQNDWQTHFAPLPEGASWTVVPSYLSLDIKARKDTTPVILRSNEDGIKYYTVSQEVIRVSEAVKDHWRTLQELAGVLYEFPVKLKEAGRK